MYVSGVGEGWFPSDQILAAENDLMAVVQSGVSDDGSINSKEGAVGEGAACGQTGNTTSTTPGQNQGDDVLGGGICLIASLVE